MQDNSREKIHPGDLKEGRFDERFSTFVYTWRWLLVLIVLSIVVFIAVTGVGRLGAFRRAVLNLGDTTTGSGNAPTTVFDPSLHIWFAGLDNGTVETYYDIERRFIAEDFILVAYTADKDPLGVFSRESLSAIARLTEGFLTIPGVRHVRSLTQNPWIRWGTIEDEAGSEEGLLISDLVDVDPSTLTDDQIIERMIAVLGAEGAAARVGEVRVRAVLGASADFKNHIGEPLLLGTIVNPLGTTTAIQIQVLRPRENLQDLTASLGDDPGVQAAAMAIYTAQFQRAAYRGIQHFLRLEQGLAVPTPNYEALSQWVESVPDLTERDRLRLALKDPTKNFMQDGSGKLVRKYFEYDVSPDGGFVDSSGPAGTLEAPESFRPKPQVPYTFHTGGEPLFEKNFEDVAMADGKLVPLMFMIIILCLAVAIPGVMGVVASVFVTLIAIVATTTYTFALGNLLNNMTAMTPNVLMAIAIADTIHLVASWSALRGRYDDKRTLIIEVVRRNSLPLFLTSITTAVGFSTLMVSSIRPVDLFGSMCAFGAITAYVITMAAVPALLSLMPHRRSGEPVKQTLLLRLFSAQRVEALSDFVVRRRGPIVAITGTLTVTAVIGLAMVQIDNNIQRYFPDDNPVMTDYRWIEGELGGVGDLEIVFTGASSTDGTAVAPTPEQQDRLLALRIRRVGAAQGVTEAEPLTAQEHNELSLLETLEKAWHAARIGLSPEFLGQLDRFEARIREEMADPESPLRVVTDLVSPLDVLRKMNQVQNENRAAFYRIPQDQDVPSDARKARVRFDAITEELAYTPGQNGASLVAQYYLQYENGARPGEALTTQLTADRTKFRMQGRIKLARSNTHLAAARRIEEIAGKEFPTLTVSSQVGQEQAGMLEMSVSGRTVLHALTGTMVATEFITAMLLALLAITILIGIVFRSVRLGLVSMLPNVLPIVAPLSVFGFLGVPLDGPAAFVSAIALGVCVDDSIHLIAQFRESAKHATTPKGRVAYTLQHVGPPITITTIVLFTGFSTMLFSAFSPNVLLGMLVTVTIALAWISDLIVTPAVLSFMGGSTNSEATVPQEGNPQVSLALPRS